MLNKYFFSCVRLTHAGIYQSERWFHRNDGKAASTMFGITNKCCGRALKQLPRAVSLTFRIGIGIQVT
jgi:hypothetical protein